MLEKRHYRQFAGWFVDLAATGAAISLALGPGLFHLSRYNVQEAVMAIPAFGAVWLQLRLVPIVAPLADRAWRESLALTLIPARTYLARRLRWTILRALAPVCVLLWINYYYLAYSHEGSNTARWLGIAVFLGAAYLGGALSLIGVWQLFIRLCRRPSNSGPTMFLLPLTWAALASAVPAGFWFLLLAIGERRRLGEAVALGIGAAAMLVLTVAARVVCGWFWRRVCRNYYHFDVE